MLEDLIKGLTAAIEANTAANLKVIATLQGKAGSATAETKTTTGSGTKPAGNKGSTKPKTPDIKDVAATVTAYLKDGDKEARAAAAANVKAIVEYYEAPKFTEIAAENLTRALAMIEEFKAGDTPEELASGDEEEGDEGESMV